MNLYTDKEIKTQAAKKVAGRLLDQAKQRGSSLDEKTALSEAHSYLYPRPGKRWTSYRKTLEISPEGPGITVRLHDMMVQEKRCSAEEAAKIVALFVLQENCYDA